jgi:hypothetical protein
LGSGSLIALLLLIPGDLRRALALLEIAFPTFTELITLLPIIPRLIVARLVVALLIVSLLIILLITLLVIALLERLVVRSRILERSFLVGRFRRQLLGGLVLSRLLVRLALVLSL